MEIIKTTEELRSLIKQLETNQTNEWELVKEQLVHTVEQLKPAHLIKSTLNDLSKDKEFTDEILDKTIGMAAGFLTKKVVVGTSENKGKQLLGTAIQWGISKFVSKHAAGIKSVATHIIRTVAGEEKDKSKDEHAA